LQGRNKKPSRHNEKELKYNEFRRLANKKQSRTLISWEQLTESVKGKVKKIFFKKI
jgi:hypothetical protein